MHIPGLTPVAINELKVIVMHPLGHGYRELTRNSHPQALANGQNRKGAEQACAEIWSCGQALLFAILSSAILRFLFAIVVYFVFRMSAL